MGKYQLQIEEVLVAIAWIMTVVTGSAVAHSQETCTYTFQVPRGAGDNCMPGGQPDPDTSRLQQLQALLTGQHKALEQQLSAIAAQLATLGAVPSASASGVGDDADAGTTYVRWGRTTCTDNASVIYEGFAGKSKYNEGGGGNYLCLPKDPEFHANASSIQNDHGSLYGVEYRVHGSRIADNSPHDQDMPCAVCDVTGRSRLLMVPAKVTCPDGWTREYQGLLMSEHHTHRQAEFICVSDGMETLSGGHAYAGHGFVYTVAAVCGSLPCPPYVNGYEMLCVVCTK